MIRFLLNTDALNNKNNNNNKAKPNIGDQAAITW